MSRTHGEGRSTTTAGAPPETTPAEEPATDPRMTRSRRRALGATLDLVAERGIAGASIEAVSARSGVAKTTVYRQWPNQAALVLDAFRSIAPDPPLPDTGTLPGPLVLVGGFAEALRQGRAGVFMAALMDAAERDADFAALHAAETRRRHAPVLSCSPGASSGASLPDGADLDALVDQLAGPVLHRRFVSGLPLDRGFGERVVDGVLRACTAR